MKKDKHGNYSCVLGEVSGSAHAFMNADDVEVVHAEVQDSDGTVRNTILAIVKNATEFSHYQTKSKDQALTEEHATLLLNPICKGAVYEINRQVELASETEWNNEIKPVID